MQDQGLGLAVQAHGLPRQSPQRAIIRHLERDLQRGIQPVCRSQFGFEELAYGPGQELVPDRPPEPHQKFMQSRSGASGGWGT